MSIGKVILVVLATLVIFSTGLVTGVVLVKQVPKAAAANPPMPPQGPGWPQFLHRVTQELELTPEQHQRIATILRESQDRTRGLARSEFGKVREQIRAELMPGQRERFERLLQERQRRNPEMMPQQNRPFQGPNGPMQRNDSFLPEDGRPAPFNNRPPKGPAPNGPQPVERQP